MAAGTDGVLSNEDVSVVRPSGYASHVQSRLQHVVNTVLIHQHTQSSE